MTALDIFEMYAGAAARVKEAQSVLDRRLALIDEGGRSPSSADAGDRDDGHPLLAEYVSDVGTLRERVDESRRQRDAIRACCIYLSEQLPALLGEVMIRTYVEGLSLSGCGRAMSYSTSQIKRLKREAVAMCRDGLRVISWDGEHVPIVSVPDDRTKTREDEDDVPRVGGRRHCGRD